MGQRLRAFGEEEAEQQQHRRRQRSHHRRMFPSKLRGADQSVHETPKPCEREQGTAPVDDRRRIRIPAFRHLAQSDPHRGNREQRVDQKNRPPRPVIDQPAPQQRGSPRGNRGRPRPDADGRPTILLIECRADERQRARHQQRRSGALNDSCNHEQRHVRRQPAAERRNGEQHYSTHEDAPPTELVSRRAADQQQRRHAQRVSVDDPLHGRKRRVQLALEPRQRHVDHRLVDECERRPQNRGRQNPRPAGSACGYARARADRCLIAGQCLRIAQACRPFDLVNGCSRVEYQRRTDGEPRHNRLQVQGSVTARVTNTTSSNHDRAV